MTEPSTQPPESAATPPTADSPPAAPPRAPAGPAQRRAIVALVVLVLAAGAFLLIRSAASRSASELARVPADAMGFLRVDAARFFGQKAEQLGQMLPRILGMVSPKIAAFQNASRLDLTKLRSALLAWRRAEKKMEGLVIVEGAFERAAVESALVSELRFEKSTADGLTLLRAPRGTMPCAFLADDVFACAHAPWWPTVVALSRGQGKSLQGTALQDFATRLSGGSVRGAVALDERTRTELGSRTPLPVPQRAALRIARENEIPIVRALLELADEAERGRAEETLKGWLVRAKTFMDRAPPAIGGMIQKAVSNVTIAGRGRELDLSMKLELPGLAGAGGAGAMGLMSAVAIPSFMKYIRRAKEAEARVNLRRIALGAKSYFGSDRVGADGKVLPRAFPPSTSATPAGSACATPDKKYAPNPSLWLAPTWKALAFEVSDPHFYRYSFDSSGQGPGARFVARAEADLGCDGKLSTMTITGSADASGDVTLSAIR